VSRGLQRRARHHSEADGHSLKGALKGGWRTSKASKAAARPRRGLAAVHHGCFTQTETYKSSPGTGGQRNGMFETTRDTKVAISTQSGLVGRRAKIQGDCWVPQHELWVARSLIAAARTEPL